MFVIKLYDRNGTELIEGDIVKVSNGKNYTFFSEVKFIENEAIIAPFHTFTFHSFVKVANVPADAIKINLEERYNCWYSTNRGQVDKKAGEYVNYYKSWKDCEYKIEDRCFRIEKQLSAEKK